MKTTLDLPDEVMRAVKVRAAEDNLELKEVVTNLLSSKPTESHSRCETP